ncbi:MAG: haloalkane dehalogenase [Rhodospirillaceae bacterium]
MSDDAIAADNPYPSKTVDVLDSHIAYLEAGDANAGRAIVLIHGNPTSSHIWRNVIPHLEGLGRCLAPDLIGMGGSGKPAGCAYRYADHIRYLDAWFDAVAPTGPIIFVVQDWGAALGFDWIRRHPERVAGLCYMEAMVQPRQWKDLPSDYEARFRTFRTPEGRQAAIDANLFVEKVLPNGVARGLTDAEMAVYRAPFAKPEDRMPTIQWPCEIAFDGEPADNHARIQAYADWLAASNGLPKLFVNTTDGHALLGRNRDFCRAWPNQKEVTLSGKHYIQEDDPHGLGRAVAAWLGEI